jgi:pyruvate-formate lyase-activating enzyme
MSKKKRKVEESPEYGFPDERGKKFPSNIMMDVTNVCNLRCVHCPHKSFSRKKGYIPTHLDWKLFRKVVNEAVSHDMLFLRFSSDGEPLLHPRFLDMLSYAKKKGINLVNMTTNGTLLTEYTNRELIKRGLDIVDVSLDAFSKKKYESVRAGAIHSVVYGNVLRLLELRDKLNSSLKVMVSMVNHPRVADEVEAFKGFWEPKVDRVLIRTYISVHGQLSGGCDPTGIKQWPCQQLFKRVVIAPEGLIKFCVGDWYNTTTLGDLRKDTIADVWQSEAYDEIRRAHLEGRFDDIEFCRGCTDWIAAPWGYGFDHAIKKVVGKRK